MFVRHNWKDTVTAHLYQDGRKQSIFDMLTPANFSRGANGVMNFRMSGHAVASIGIPLNSCHELNAVKIGTLYLPTYTSTWEGEK